MSNYDCRSCANIHTVLCDTCSFTQYPSGHESKPTYYLNGQSIPKESEEQAISLASYISNCIDNHRQIPVFIVDKYNKLFKE